MQISENILYKNNQLIAFNKPSGIAVQEDKTEDKALINLAEIYCKSNIHIIHRLDRPASGVVLFAKGKTALTNLNQQFKDRIIKKTYLAVVKNRPEADHGELTHYLYKQSNNKTVVLEKGAKGSKEAILHYEVIGSIDNYHLLKINLITGRHHQVRAQLGAIGSPIKGDVKYGVKRGNRDRSIHLHAWKLSFKHPVTKIEEEIIAPVPDDSVWNAFEIA